SPYGPWSCQSGNELTSSSSLLDYDSAGPFDSASHDVGGAHLLRFTSVADLVALALEPNAFAAQVQELWAQGKAVLPVDLRLPLQVQQELLVAMRPAQIISAQGTASCENPRPVKPEIALVMPTSGSTGAPKGVLHTHGGRVAAAAAPNNATATTAADTWLSSLPLAHIGGFSVLTRAWQADCGLEILDRFTPEAVSTSEATMVSLVPTMLTRAKTSQFRVVLLGGSSPPQDPPENCVITYGLTESGAGVVYDGAPLDGLELELREGQIFLRGPMLCVGYRDGTTPLDSAGWLATGDQGSLDEQGHLSVHGRAGDMIVSGGENVWPEPIEAALERLELVGEAAVVGESHPEWGQMVVAKIVPAQPFEIPRLPEIRRMLADELPPWSLPRRIDIVQRLPRTPLGKLKRAQILPKSS
ncbi:MAG: fatty acid--CoA ligase family protein, partial [Acidimicrobiales bacterium]